MILKNNDFKKYFVFRFPSFRFFPIPKIENLEISENCLLLQILTAVLIQHFVQLVVDKIALVFSVTFYLFTKSCKKFIIVIARIFLMFFIFNVYIRVIIL